MRKKNVWEDFQDETKKNKRRIIYRLSFVVFNEIFSSLFIVCTSFFSLALALF